MPATITYTPRAQSGINALLNGGFTHQDIQQLHTDIELWVNSNYRNWTEGERYNRSFNDNHMRQEVNVAAELVDEEAEEVEILLIEAD